MTLFVAILCRDEFWHYLGTANDEGVTEMMADDTWVMIGRVAAANGA